MTSEFDAIDYVRELEAAGVPHVQATIHAKALTAALAVIRGDLNAVARRLTALITQVKEELLETEMRLQRQLVDSEARMDARIDELRKEINERFATLEARIDARFEGIEKRIGSLELKVEGIAKELVMMRWMMGAMLTLQLGMLARMLSM